MAVHEQQLQNLMSHLYQQSGDALTNRSFVPISSQHFSESIYRIQERIVVTTQAFDYLFHHSSYSEVRCDCNTLRRVAEERKVLLLEVPNGTKLPRPALSFSQPGDLRGVTSEALEMVNMLFRKQLRGERVLPNSPCVHVSASYREIEKHPRAPSLRLECSISSATLEVVVRSTGGLPSRLRVSGVCK